MKRLAAVLVVAAAVVGAHGAAFAGAPDAIVAGSGVLGPKYGSPMMQISSHGTGTEASGVFHLAYPHAGMVAGTVTCAAVSGTTAYVVGRIDRSRNADWVVGNYVLLGVQDNGGSLDMANFSPDQAAAPGCGPSIIATPNLPLVSGGFVVLGG